ncbi:MAG: sensor domain-containing diguanylate cyclase [Gammaproteobacteria bacterium]|nr:sensor domain-containing diguanylate cyclase [Gammaproteobacteria bacterium]MBU1969856.1 sensor domain-containing diguanylate cyclase [Gammaproteobacteria bacterium]
MLVLLLFVGFGEMFLRYQADDLKNKQRMETIAHASLLRARTERELNSLLYLSSGLGSYLVVRNDSIKAKEVNDILAVLHRSSSHIRNFGVAIGYRLTFVYPLKGNEKAIGLHYPSQPQQWPVIKQIIESGQPALAGPVQLVQGGSGLIYRVPLFISGKYWGLLSTVIDTESFFMPIDEEFGEHRFEFAVRGKDGQGLGGEMVWGDAALFEDSRTFVQMVEVPGGNWAIGVRIRDGNLESSYAPAIRLLALLLGGLIAWMMYLLIRNRAELAHLAMYDQLTGLPNRNLFEDRVRMAFARQKRTPGQQCALLFLDLDGFKEINDNYGHRVGDLVLSISAERARNLMRQNDTVARWGGDEFIVLIENATQAAVDSYMRRLRERIEQPIDCDGTELKVGVSIGNVMYDETSGDLDEMLKMADHRMYADKDRRK